MTINKFKPAVAALLAAAAISAAPASAVRVQLVATGTIASGTDSGNDLTSVDVINNVYVEHFAPSSIFGSNGSLIGKSITFRTVYDVDSPDVPIGAGGVFSDPVGSWTLAMAPTVTINGISRDVFPQPPGSLYSYNASLALTDGAPDAFSGSFGGFALTFSTIDKYVGQQIDFSGTLPSSFFSTDALLPGDAGLPGRGYANAAATGTGTFNFQAQTCFYTCSYKQAVGGFTLDRILFSAVPEPESWALMIAGFGLTGLLTRRRRIHIVTA